MITYKKTLFMRINKRTLKTNKFLITFIKHKIWSIIIKNQKKISKTLEMIILKIRMKHNQHNHQVMLSIKIKLICK